MQASIENRPVATGKQIRVLPPELISRIAAGEVVERPASVVKELVENALDAGARRIHIELLSGGRDLIRVSDDGCGMSREDLALCVLPHATSKIQTPEDLDALLTLGFRGEALPSIAAVSHFSMLTRAKAEKSNEAWKIEINGGQPDKPEAKPAAGAFGTSAEVRNLFYNLPAREKFLKGPGVEAAACTDTLLRLALTRPDVSFTLKTGSQEIISLNASSDKPAANTVGLTPALPLSAYLRRAREVLGADASKGLVEVCAQPPSDPAMPGIAETKAALTPLSASYAGYRLYGLISPPTVTRPNRSSIYLTVNGRAVKDRTLTSALLESYRHLLPPRRYPAGVLFLELPSGDVDINVHPTKAEVRFRLSGLVYGLLHHAVRSACGLLDSAGVRPPEELAESLPRPITPAKPPLGAPRPLNGQGTLELSFGSENRTGEGVKGRNGEELVERADTETRRPGDIDSNFENVSVAEAPAEFSTAPTVEPHVSPSPVLPLSRSSASENAPDKPAQTSAPPAFRILGQAAGSYIVLEDDTGVKLIDQHALHERILFEELLARAEGRARGDAQGLLIAETLELTPVQTAVFAQDEAAQQILSSLGFDVESFGPRSVAVRAVPAILKGQNAASLVRDVLDALAGADVDAPASKKTGRVNLREKAAYILSCKGAIKAGERLTREQMEALVLEFHKKAGNSPFTCPHGRPLALELSWEELEKAVGRR